MPQSVDLIFFLDSVQFPWFFFLENCLTILILFFQKMCNVMSKFMQGHLFYKDFLNYFIYLSYFLLIYQNVYVYTLYMYIAPEFQNTDLEFSSL